ncbi:stefin-C-like [Micropterus salmoides]|uniref:stefin-C-like n=1 Tax=Micropterus salmoides TaxID=27706 RepID=UPI0018EE0384|nr:stefin-C-like [Micropterus salmoides]
MAMLGGFSETQNATGDIQKICDQVKSQAEGKTNKKYKEFKAVKYRSQTVAGQNYLIKVHVGGSGYLVLKVFESLPCNGGAVTLQGVKDHQKDAPIVPF